MQLISAPCDRRQTYRLGLIRCKIASQQLFEAGQQVFVHDLARHELPVVKADAVVEQYLDIGRNDLFGMLVDGILQFFPDLTEAVDECLVFDDGLDAVLDYCKDTTGIRDLEQAAEHLAAHALYMIEVEHATSVSYTADMVNELF